MTLIISRVWLENCLQTYRSHPMANALSRLPNQIKPIRVTDQTYDVHMFTLQPKWL
jgi:hypothetical protein